MPKDFVHTEVDGFKLKLSNLQKVLYPSLGLTKAEVIQYYLSMAPRILRYIQDRPLTVIRFPDGVGGKSFYSKDKPDWTPEWIDSMLIQHENKLIDYLTASNTASIVWLANLACLELHPTQFTADNKMKPDLMIIDLDPDVGIPFERVKEMAFLVNKFFENYGYTGFIKTSGGKGLHIHFPIIPEADYDQVTEEIKSLARIFVSQHTSLSTLQINKEKRKGKILIDIYRNHLTNTTVAPFSLRGKVGAPISMPFFWDDLEAIDRSNYFNVKNYKSYLDKKGDAWQNWRDAETSLHSLKTQIAISAEDIDDRLKLYLNKRNFKETPEPPPKIDLKDKNKFCIQIHNATNLHYDLRLEDNGVLLSWAIPKGLPYEKGEKRLAIRTEDHPIKYLHFEGTIPRGSYGAGKMWLFDNGKINWIKKKERSLHFELVGHRIKNKFKLYQTKTEDQWLIECEKSEGIDHLNISPMLAETSKEIPTGRKYRFEVKWDGIRAVIYINNDEIKIISRGGRDITKSFPEFQNLDAFKFEQGILDTEIVVLDEEGKPAFHDVISRMHQGGEQSILNASKKKPATCYVFDLLYLDGISVMDAPQFKRREWLEANMTVTQQFRFSKSFADGKELFDAIQSQGMEGIIAKNQNGLYRPGQRTRDWFKIKCRFKDTAFIIGYTKGKGDRSDVFGALHLAKMQEEKYVYMGKVGTGFDSKKLKSLHSRLSSVIKSVKLIEDKIEEESRTVWIKPIFSCEIEYASMSSNGTYREPVFVRLIE